MTEDSNKINFSLIKSLAIWYLGSSASLLLILAVISGELFTWVSLVIFIALIPTILGAFVQKWLYEFKNRHKKAETAKISADNKEIDYLAMVASLGITVIATGIFEMGFLLTVLLAVGSYKIIKKLNK